VPIRVLDETPNICLFSLSQHYERLKIVVASCSVVPTGMVTAGQEAEGLPDLGGGLSEALNDVSHHCQSPLMGSPTRAIAGPLVRQKLIERLRRDGTDVFCIFTRYS